MFVDASIWRVFDVAAEKSRLPAGFFMKQSETAYLTWDTPAIVIAWEWRNEILPTLKKLYRLFVFCSFLLGIPALGIVYSLAPERLPRVTGSLTALTFLYPLALGFQMWFGHRSGSQYRIKDKGLLRHSSNKGRLYKWSDIGGYRFFDHAGAPGIRVLEVTIKRYKKPISCCFDSGQTSERDITDLLSQFGAHPIREEIAARP